MEYSILISLCLLLLLAYVFDISASKTKIPSVILLLLVGWAVRQGTDAFSVSIPNLNPILPVLGTVGLILIVLEGSLELELNRDKLRLVGTAAVISFCSILLFSFGMAFALQYFGNVPFKTGLANAIPLSIISSAIAIPTAQNLIAKDREFVTYESSLSDIFGVIFFNFIVLNDSIGAASIGNFTLDIIVIFFVTFVATIGLAYLLSKIKHHVKFVPIILMIILIYYASKVYHLPALVFIFIFGLFLGNLDEFKSNRFIKSCSRPS